MQETTTNKRPAWVEIVKRYTVPDPRKSSWQLINSLVPFFAIWVLMYFSLSVSYLLTLALAFLNAMFLMRIFIIQHDCGHNSFFKETELNNLVGTFLGVITFTPYYAWRNSHAKHHASSGDLDFRGFGDVETLTVEEYKALPFLRKMRYRFYRHPLVLFVIGPTIMFTVLNRFPTELEKGQKREKDSIYFTNLALALVFLGAGAWIGFAQLILMWVPLMIFGSSIGVYLFYVQHQFEDTYWRWHAEWDYAEAALRGSSFFKLPKLLQWFSGNIGFHHLHHLSPKIPNYNLPKAFEENTLFQHVTAVTLWESFEAASLKLWDEEHKKLVSFRHLKSAASQ